MPSLMFSVGMGKRYLYQVREDYNSKMIDLYIRQCYITLQRYKLCNRFESHRYMFSFIF